MTPRLPSLRSPRSPRSRAGSRTGWTGCSRRRPRGRRASTRRAAPTPRAPRRRPSLRRRTWRRWSRQTRRPAVRAQTRVAPGPIMALRSHFSPAKSYQGARLCLEVWETVICVILTERGGHDFREGSRYPRSLMLSNVDGRRTKLRNAGRRSRPVLATTNAVRSSSRRSRRSVAHVHLHAWVLGRGPWCDVRGAVGVWRGPAPPRSGDACRRSTPSCVKSCCMFYVRPWNRLRHRLPPRIAPGAQHISI